MADIITYPGKRHYLRCDDASGYLATRPERRVQRRGGFLRHSTGRPELQVSAGSGMGAPGAVQGPQHHHGAATTVVLTEADPVRSRIDRVVLRYDAAAKKTRLQVLEGVPNSAGPAAPAITRTELIYDLCLAEIKRPAAPPPLPPPTSTTRAQMRPSAA